MSFSSLLQTDITVVRRSGGARDPYGNKVAVDAASVTYKGDLQQTTGSEVTQNGNVQTSDWLLFLPIEAQLDGGDKVVVGGVTYEVVGPPARPRNHHVEARLRATARG